MSRSCASNRARRPLNLTFEELQPRQLLAGDIILHWNDVMLDANARDHALAAPEQGGPILTARAFAIASVAMYDAYNSIHRIGEEYLTTVPRAGDANSDAAVAQAAHDALVALFPSQTAIFDAELHSTLSHVRNGRAEDFGRAVGRIVAREILAARADDGAADLAQTMYLPNGLPGFHDVDPLHPGQGFYAAGAMHIAPFAVESMEQFPARHLDDATPEGRLAFMQTQEYLDAYNEVLSFGADGVDNPTVRTKEQTQIGIFWGYDGRPGLGTPPRLYNQIAVRIANQEHNSEAENARLFALINVAMSDAGCSAWNTKYDDAFWRPVLAIREGASDGNPLTAGDADWHPLGAPASNPRPGETDFTPPFPAYTSGHATFGAAAFQTLARFYHTDDISFSFMSDEFNGRTRDDDGSIRPRLVRTFDSLTEAKLENAQSRIYLGIHWRFDADEGIAQGDAVANYIFEHILAPRRRQHDAHDALLASAAARNGDGPAASNDVPPTSVLLVTATPSAAHAPASKAATDLAFADLDTSDVALCDAESDAADDPA
jgi:hypothetical protein